MTWLQSLVAEFAITIASEEVWLAIGLALVFGGACLIFGIWAARAVGLLERSAPAGETLGVGLGSGVIVLAAWWAAVSSGGRSSFTPVAIGFAIAIGLALTQRAQLFSHGVLPGCRAQPPRPRRRANGRVRRRSGS